MRTSPSIAPHDGHEDVYLVLDDFGSLGRAWRETDEAGANRAALVRNLLDGQYEHPVRIVAFNTTEGWSRDVSVDIADELRRRYVEYDEVPEPQHRRIAGTRFTPIRMTMRWPGRCWLGRFGRRVLQTRRSTKRASA
jgi:hypothetical protein